MKITPATAEDVSDIRRFIMGLAKYENLEHEMVATEDDLRETLFGERCYAEVVFAEDQGERVGFALFFHNYSTFLGKPGIYLEDLFVWPEHRGKGYGKQLLAHVAKVSIERNCGRYEWSVLDWNKPSIDFYESFGAELKKEWIITRLTGDKLKQLAESASNQ